MRVVLASGQPTIKEAARIVRQSGKIRFLGRVPHASRRGTRRVQQFPGGDTEENTDVRGLLTETLADLAKSLKKRQLR